MDARMFAGGSVRRFRYLFLGLLFSIFTVQCAQAAPVVVSVDHRVTVSYSKPQFDANKGVYTTKVRIRNRSAASLLSPLRLTLEQFEGKPVKPLNAQSSGNDGRPYFEFALPKGLLAKGKETEPVKVVFAVGKSNNIGATRERTGIKSLLPAFTYHVSAGVELALLQLNATPSDLPANSGKKAVRFSVPLLGKTKSSTNVYLRRSGDKQSIAMNDFGKDGDAKAKDGVQSVDVQIDTDKVKPDTCTQYEAFIKQGSAELTSQTVRLCVSSFPVKLAESNMTSPAIFPDGSKAVADEILLTVTPTTTAAAIRQLASSVHANVVGSYMTLNLYQLKLPSRLNVNQLLEIVAQLKARAGVVSASINVIGSYAYTPDDTAFNLPPTDINSQHGLKLVLAHSPGVNAWDGNTRGAGVTVVVMDSGLDLSHSDLGPSDIGDPAWTCQLAGAPDLVPCTDLDGHGTQVAGVIAAKTHNTLGVAGVAFKSKIHSIRVSANSNVNAGQMITGFTSARDYLATPHPEATVFNASFYAAGGSATAADWATVCGLIEQVVFNGMARAVVVNAVGNNNMNGVVYPARCKDLNPANLLHPDLLISVSNSISIDNTMPAAPAIDPLCLPLDNPAETSLNQRCRSSNFGSWVDIAAPGSSIRTTSIGNTYPTPTGNSFSAPFVAGAAAILNSCGLSPGQIKPTITSSADTMVSYPAYPPYLVGTTPRLDIYRALQSQAPTAPTLSAPESYTEGVSLNLTDIVITSNLSGCATYTATLTLSDIVAGSLSTGTSGTVTSTFVGGVWTASGPMADVNALLAGVTFIPSPNYNSNFNIATSVTDGITTITGSKAMTGTAVNSPPVNTTPAPQTATEGVVKVIGGISVVDADAGAMPITMTLTVTNGTISVNPAVVGGVTAPNIMGNGTASITLTGSQSQINTTLANAAGVTYLPTLGGAATLTVMTSDNGASGGSAQTDTDVITITVTAVHPPIIANQTLPNINENSGNGTTVGTVVASDPDVGDVLTYSITAGNTGNAFAINPGTGEITVNNALALDYETTPTFNLTVRVTDPGMLFASATVTINLNNLPEAIPNPILVYDHKSSGVDGLGNTVDWYHFTVSNWNAYPAAMFVARPDLPPCGLNLSASRTWVDFFKTSDNSRIYGFCALGTPANLNLIWIGMVPAGTAPPASVYIKLIDRETGIEYTSNSVAVPFP